MMNHKLKDLKKDMMSKYSKHLIVSADSMGSNLVKFYKSVQHVKSTNEGKFFSNFDKLPDPFPIWPELLAEKLNLNNINLSIPGLGNRAIFERAVDEISKYNPNDIGLVVIMWSEWTRVDIRVPRYNKYFRVRGRDRVHEIIHKTNYLDKLNKLDTYEFIKMITDLNLMYVYMLQNYLDNLNIKHIMISGLNPIADNRQIEKFGVELEKNYERYLIDHILDSHFFELIDKKNYIGFPGFKKTGGFSYDNYLGKLDKDRSKTRIGNAFKIIGRPFDMHPNEYGNKLGFELIYEHYKKTFKI